jgi:hypothetical protein
MKRHRIQLDPIPGGWIVSGAVSFKCAAAPIVAAAAKLIEDGVATLDDMLEVKWTGHTTFIASIGAMARYEKSSARRGMERVGAYESWS